MVHSGSQTDSDQEIVSSIGSSASAGGAPISSSTSSHQALLLDIYSSIGEPDSLYGASAGCLGDGTARLRMYEHEKEWYKALGEEIFFYSKAVHSFSLVRNLLFFITLLFSLSWHLLMSVLTNTFSRAVDVHRNI